MQAMQRHNRTRRIRLPARPVARAEDWSLPAIGELATLPIKALTISQPYASLIAGGSKIVENRTWDTRYRGPLAIHAGRGLQYLDRDQLADYPHGGIIAVARLVACLNVTAIQTASPDTQIAGTIWTYRTLRDHAHTEGPWCWVLSDVRRCRFIPCRGAQGLWDFMGSVGV